MRVLGIDHGAKRIGLALSDEEGRIAFPEGVLASNGLRKDVAAICDLIVERGVERVVVGLPKHMDGRAGEQAQAAQAFANALANSTSAPVETLDERLSTVEANRALQADGKRGRARAKKRKAVVDAVAASIILDTYLRLCESRGDFESRSEADGREQPPSATEADRE